MENTEKQKRTSSKLELLIILLLCAATLVLDFTKITYVENQLHNKFVSKIVQQGIGVVAVILLLKRLKVRLFGMPQNLLFLIPCLIVAIDNFQWASYINGNMELVNDQPIDFILFGGYCSAVGFFEEFIFRGLIFAILADRLPKTKAGLWKVYILSSLIFAAAHLLNGFSFGTLLQVGYTFLTGGLFGFILLKTKNLLFCGLIHALYNFCGLLFDTSNRMGLGNGVVFDIGTVITMFVVSVAAGIFVLYHVKKYSGEEQRELYQRMGISMDKT